jgi:PTH1 family peptidyl-tRNA hydrolase
VGLGNPGLEYQQTPHNLGFEVVDRLAARHSILVKRKESAALVGLGRIEGCRVVLAKPQTYMNVSGPSVSGLCGRYELAVSDLLLIYDDLALPWTQLRIRPRGSSGGHHGVDSVIRSVGSGEFARLRLGIHPGHPIADGAKFVLSPFRKAQWKELDELLELGARAVESVLAEGVDKAMAKFNRRAQGESKEEA